MKETNTATAVHRAVEGGPAATGVIELDPLTPLDDGQVACRFCGQATDGESVWLAERQPERPERPDHMRRMPDPAPAGVGLCGDCRGRHEHAEAIAQVFTADEAARLGDRRRDRTESARVVAGVLRVFALLDIDVADELSFAQWESRDHYLHSALARLGYPGPAARVQYDASADFRPTKAASLPWSWVPNKWIKPLAQALDRADAEDHAHGEEVLLAPPQGTGCGWCGLAALPMAPRLVHRLGGRQRASRELWRRRAGKWLCDRCVSAWVDTGGQPAQAVRHAALSAAGVRVAVEQVRAEGRRVRLPRITPWWRVALDNPDTPGSPSGWEHLHPDGLAGFAAECRAALVPPAQREPTVDDLAAEVQRLKEMVTYE